MVPETVRVQRLQQLARKSSNSLLRLARENKRWGFRRIVGALSNLGHQVSHQTMGNILKRHGLGPAPEREKTTTWREFIRMHMAVLKAPDFFTSAVWNWCGLVCFAFLFIPCGRCKVQVISLAACLNSRCADWYVDAASWIHWVLEEGLSQLCPLRTPVQRLILFEFAPHEHQPRLPQGMRKGSVLPVVAHRPIRDGPRRNRPGLGGLLQDDNRAAA